MDGACDTPEGPRAQQPTPLGLEEPSKSYRLPWPGRDALYLTLPAYHLQCPEPSSDRTLLPPALGSLREGSLWGVSIWEEWGCPSGDSWWGQLEGTTHPQGPTCCAAYGRTVQASVCGGRGSGSHSHPRHVLGLIALGLALETSRVKSHGAHPRGDQALGDRPLDRPHLAQSPDGGSSEV